MNHELQLKYDVMSRVRAVNTIRTLLSSPLMSALVGIALVLSLSIIVSIGDVIKNTMAHVDWSERFFYTYSSLIHSRLIVQTLITLTAFSSIALIINSIRTVRRVTFGSTQQI